ncbi:apolipoprotein N-acyltransferase [Mycobacterium basiliense]|nr:apolipoprotein N-acyltransferase [Mycobacterium basiliense]
MALDSGACRRRALGWAAALALGTLPALAFPAPSWWWLAWFAVVPLLLVVRAAATSGDGAVRAFLGVGGFVLTNQYWLASSIGPVLALMAFGLGALWLPWGWVTHRLLSPPVSTRRVAVALIVVPSAWVAAEAVRSWPPLGGPWAALGASQWNQPATLASASLGGVWLTSFLVIAANTALASAIVQRGAGRLVALGCALACMGFGPVWYVAGGTPPASRTVRVALVQTGPIADAAARQAASEALTATLVGTRPEVVVWGESSVAAELTDRPDAVARLAELARRVGADLLVNVDARAPNGGIYKTSVLVDDHGVQGSYRKTRLVPFGEYVPLRPFLGAITRYGKAAAEDRGRGSGPVVLRAGGIDVGPLISYETTFSDLTRRAALLGAQLLVYQSSTSSFQGSWAQPQLAGQPAVRAVEVGLPAVHAGLSGDSSAFDSRGRRLAWCTSQFTGVTVISVPLTSDATPYRRWGDWVPASTFAVLGVFFGVATLRSLRRRDTLR